MQTYTRVTDVLYPFSGLAKVPLKVLENAAERGERVHKEISNDIKRLPNVEPLIDEEILGYWTSYRQWVVNIKEEMVIPERWYCEKHMITGSADCLIKNESGWTLIDFKTPASESKTWMLQGSAYSYLAKLNGLSITKIQFIKLSKIGKKAIVYEYEENFALYLDCLRAYRYFFKTPIDDALEYL